MPTEFTWDEFKAEVRIFLTERKPTNDLFAVAAADYTRARIAQQLLNDRDGGTLIEAYIDGSKVATLTVAAGTTLVNDEELAVTLSLTNGEAVAKTMAIDYVLAVQER